MQSKCDSLRRRRPEEARSLTPASPPLEGSLWLWRSAERRPAYTLSSIPPSAHYRFHSVLSRSAFSPENRRVQDAVTLQELKRLLPQCLLPDQVRLGQQLARALAGARSGPAPAMPLNKWLAEAEASIALRGERGARRGSVRLLRWLSHPDKTPPAGIPLAPSSHHTGRQPDNRRRNTRTDARRLFLRNQ